MRRWTVYSLIGASSVVLSIASTRATDPVPFGAGERLTYSVRTAHLGSVGHAEMSLTGPVDVRGTSTLLASFDTRISVAFMKGSNTSRSWIDPIHMASLRFTKEEHRPLSSNTDSVEVFPERHHWEGANGQSGTTSSDAPLDELSFIYFLRTVTLVPDSTYSYDRHYDQRRSPTTVRVIKRETLQTTAGEFRTTELEMRVKDGTDYKGEGVLHLWFSEDRCHLPVRIESDMPLLGTGIMTLETAVTPACPADEHGVRRQ